MKTLRLFCCALLLLSFISVSAQTNEQKKAIIQKTNVGKLDALKQKLLLESKQKKEKAIITAKSTNNPVIKHNSDGSFDELMGVFADGSLNYFALDNINAAKSTRANHLNSGGSLGLNLNGQNMLGGVWDGGPARISHSEFNNRVSIGDGNTVLNNNSFHMTHVTGTITATGIDFEAKGMANQANVKTFDWSNDTTEVIDEIIENGLLLSNHSYGTRASQVPTWIIGAYITESRIWDEIAYSAPYYLMVTSAGNEGNFFNPEPSTPFFDKLTTNKNSKNNLVIANAQDAIVSPGGNLMFVNINGSSSQGPSDDNRIKPDITGNGTGLYSTNSNNDFGYTTLSGTSMSGPNVMGTLLLLQQYHNQLHSQFMWSSTLKGLACHTADDAGNPGPDVSFGWGLLNAKKAAETLTENGLSSWVSEEILSQNETFSFTVNANGIDPLVASITWTDVAGETNNGQLNDTTPVLVQDLDLRISDTSEIFFPYKLQSDANLNAIQTEDNAVDNVEQVRIDNPSAQEYVITVTHKGNLVNNKQSFSLVITGLSSNFAIRTKGNDYEICNNETLSVPFDFVTNINEMVVFETSNLPEGVVSNFSVPSSSTNTSVMLELSNFQNIPGGTYEFGISASHGDETETRNIRMKIFSSEFNPVTYLMPFNGQETVTTSTIFEWSEDVNVENYTFQLSLSPSFENLVFETETQETNFTYSNLSQETVYYWRIIPENRCATSENLNFSTFQTGISDCGLVFTATDFSNAEISDFANAVATIPIVVDQNFSIDNLTVSLDVTHTWVQDLTIYLQGPIEIGSPTIKLMEEACGGENDINVIFTDAGTQIICAMNPAISGNILPFESLSNFSNLLAQGTWNIIVEDSFNQDGGIVNNASLSFCNISALSSDIELVNNSFSTLINTDKIIENSEILATTQNQINTNHTYTILEIPILGELINNGIPMTVGSVFSQNEINLGNIIYSNNQSQPGEDSFLVTIVNEFQSWLPNQIVNIQISETLGFEGFEDHKIKVYPNPSSGILFIKANDFWENANVIVTDITGRKMMQSTISKDESTINLSHLSEGMYLISVAKDAQKSTFKILLKR